MKKMKSMPKGPCISRTHANKEQYYMFNMQMKCLCQILQIKMPL